MEDRNPPLTGKYVIILNEAIAQVHGVRSRLHGVFGCTDTRLEHCKMIRYMRFEDTSLTINP
jgi:hypothetical protein